MTLHEKSIDLLRVSTLEPFGLGTRPHEVKGSQSPFGRQAQMPEFDRVPDATLVG